MRDAYYNKLNGEKTFLGCKIPAEQESISAETNDNTDTSSAYMTTAKTTEPTWCEPTQLNDLDLYQLSPCSPTIHEHINSNTPRLQDTPSITTPTSLTTIHPTIHPTINQSINSISNSLKPNLCDKTKE